MKDGIKLLDVVVLTTNVPEDNLYRGEIGAVVECYAEGIYDVEFVAQDGYTYALVTLRADQLIALRERPTHDADDVVAAMGWDSRLQWLRDVRRLFFWRTEYEEPTYTGSCG